MGASPRAGEELAVSPREQALHFTGCIHECEYSEGPVHGVRVEGLGRPVHVDRSGKDAKHPADVMGDVCHAPKM